MFANIRHVVSCPAYEKNNSFAKLSINVSCFVLGCNVKMAFSKGGRWGLEEWRGEVFSAELNIDGKPAIER